MAVAVALFKFVLLKKLRYSSSSMILWWVLIPCRIAVDPGVSEELLLLFSGRRN